MTLCIYYSANQSPSMIWGNFDNVEKNDSKLHLEEYTGDNICKSKIMRGNNCPGWGTNEPSKQNRTIPNKCKFSGSVFDKHGISNQ